MNEEKKYSIVKEAGIVFGIGLLIGMLILTFGISIVEYLKG